MSAASNLRRVGYPALLLTVGLAAPAAAQTFQKNTTQIPSGNPGNNSRSENVDFADVDLDGDFDAAFADGGDGGNDQNRLWMNQGGAQGGTIGFFVDDTAARFPNVQDTSRDFDFVDIDADGDDDAYISNTAQVSNQSNRFWINQGGIQAGSVGFFVDETLTRWVGIAGAGSSVANSLALGSGGFVDWSCDCVFGDIDNDGDIDLVHSTYGGSFAGSVPSRLFLNDGNGFYSEFNPSGFQLSGSTINNGNPGLWCEGSFQNGTSNATGAQCDIADMPLGVEIGDFDADFDIDILQGSRNTLPRVYKNNLEENFGSLTYFRDVTFAVMTENATGGGNYEQEVGDLDADGDLDIYGLNWTGLSDSVQRNDGTGVFGTKTTLPGSSSDDNEGDFFDYNNDGNLDIFVSNFSGQDRLYHNTGPGGGHSFNNVTSTEVPSYFNTGLGGDPADVDNDGDQDFIVANDGNQANAFLKNVGNIPDAIAPYLPNLEQAPNRLPSPVPTVVRVQFYDNASWSMAQHMDVDVEYNVDGGAFSTVDAVYAGAQLFRAEIPGNLTGIISYRAVGTDFSGNVGMSSFKAYDSGGTCTNTPSTYCTSKVNSDGCAPPIGSTGQPSASAGSGFDITATNVIANTNGLFFYSKTGSNNLPFQGGFLCIAPPATRTPGQNSGGAGACGGSFSIDFNAYIASGADPALIGGQDVWGQYWSRDVASPSTTSLTDGITFQICP